MSTHDSSNINNPNGNNNNNPNSNNNSNGSNNSNNNSGSTPTMVKILGNSKSRQIGKNWSVSFIDWVKEVQRMDELLDILIPHFFKLNDILPFDREDIKGLFGGS